MFHQYFLFTTSAWFLGGFLLTLAVLFLIFRSRTKNWSFGIDSIFLFSFLIFFLISFLFRLQPYGFQEFVAFTIGPFFYFLAKRNRFDLLIQKKKFLFAWILSSLAFLVSFYGICVFVFEHYPRLSSIFRGAEAFTTYPNTFAFFLLMIFPFSAFLLFKSEKLYQKVMAGFFFIVQLSAFFLTFSRGAFLAFFGSLLIFLMIFLIVSFRNNRKFFTIWLRTFFLLISFFLLSAGLSFTLNELHRLNQPVEISSEVPLTEDVFGRLSDQEKSADQSTDERLQFFQGSFELIKKYPWFGVGSDGFRFQYPSVQQEWLATSTHPHNLFLKIAVENGILAALSFFLFILIIFVSNAWKLIQSSQVKENWFWHVALLTSFVATISHLLVDYNLNAMILWLLFWLIMSGTPTVISLKPLCNITQWKNVFNALFVLGGTVFLIMSLSYIFEYSTIKKADDALKKDDLKMFINLIASLNHNSIFQPLRYELMGEYAVKNGVQEEEQKVFESFLNSGIKNYPEWPEIQIASARVLFASKKFEQAKESYSKALELNALNNLDWHFEYLISLKRAGFISQIDEKENYYFELLQAYLKKLQNNEHNTVATKNPEAGYNIIEFFLSRFASNQNTGQKWQKLQSDYEKIWKKEYVKFQKIFSNEF